VAKVDALADSESPLGVFTFNLYVLEGLLGISHEQLHKFVMRQLPGSGGKFFKDHTTSRVPFINLDFNNSDFTTIIMGQLDHIANVVHAILKRVNYLALSCYNDRIQAQMRSLDWLMVIQHHFFAAADAAVVRYLAEAAAEAAAEPVAEVVEVVEVAEPTAAPVEISWGDLAGVLTPEEWNLSVPIQVYEPPTAQPRVEVVPEMVPAEPPAEVNTPTPTPTSTPTPMVFESLQEVYSSTATDEKATRAPRPGMRFTKTLTFYSKTPVLRGTGGKSEFSSETTREPP
jgi:hypothetical protein